MKAFSGSHLKRYVGYVFRKYSIRIPLFQSLKSSIRPPYSLRNFQLMLMVMYHHYHPQVQNPRLKYHWKDHDPFGPAKLVKFKLPSVMKWEPIQYCAKVMQTIIVIIVNRGDWF